MGGCNVNGSKCSMDGSKRNFNFCRDRKDNWGGDLRGCRKLQGK